MCRLHIKNEQKHTSKHILHTTPRLPQRDFKCKTHIYTCLTSNTSIHIMELSICTTDESRTVELTLWVVNFVICRSSRFYNTQRTWQPLWWWRNVWCFTVAEAVRRANRKLPNVTMKATHVVLKRNAGNFVGWCINRIQNTKFNSPVFWHM